jgi:predicted dehydrogenase
MGALHHVKLAALGMQVVAVVDPRLADGDGRELSVGWVAGSETGSRVQVRSLVAQVAGLEPDLWVVCVPTGGHAAVLAEICALCRDADVLVEKPVCAPGDAETVREIVAAHKGRVVVGEQYLSSKVPAVLGEQVSRLGLRMERVRVEMSKHRGHDVAAGRFQDPDLGVLGYEGSHLVASVLGLGDHIGVDLWPYGQASVVWHPTPGMPGPADEAAVPAGPDAGQRRCCAGVHVQYQSRESMHIEMYTSMAGRLGFAELGHAELGHAELGHAELGHAEEGSWQAAPDGQAPRRPDIGYGSVERFRVLSVSGTDQRGRVWEVAGAFEPVSGLPRNQAAITTWCQGRVASSMLIHDDPLEQHLRATFSYLWGTGGNPCSVGTALTQLDLLRAWACPDGTGQAERSAVAGNPARQDEAGIKVPV